MLLVSVGGSAFAGPPTEFAQLTIEQRVIIRVPLVAPPRRGRPAAAPEAQDWDEKKGPRCLAIRSIRSADLSERNSVDLILSNSQRYRARFGRGCQSAAFYSGFYIEPTDDGSLCAGRDDVKSRGGISCEVDSFKRLVPER
ncbi:hypothetical protein C1T17_18625 [Sphingobium sp. SCG-1]|uniref:hypothetical protein n=1 Tax=Sphingobium sp. SCG-1 TaxID=2072936 RepID=UPI000CD67F20|nr:hypothetical protein [Sphingobium sp. SCG-1]AUW60437.1 hypothetical protein C1T17_18625 [Sphingobium sp. SCG-1]